MISTKLAAPSISDTSRFLNSVAAAREKVTISSCSCFTSSKLSREASLCTSTRVFPLPGPAATTMYLDSSSWMIRDWVSDNPPNNFSYRSGVMFRLISAARSPLKYLAMNFRKSIWK